MGTRLPSVVSILYVMQGDIHVPASSLALAGMQTPKEYTPCLLTVVNFCALSLEMDTKSLKVFALLFVLLLVTGPKCASPASTGRCGSYLKCTGVVSNIFAVGYGVYQAYRVVKAVLWALKFADFLLKEPIVTEASVPDWLLKNPPTFTFFTPIVKRSMSDDQTEAMKDYSKRLALQRSRPDPTCDQALAEFMKTFYSSDT